MFKIRAGDAVSFANDVCLVGIPRSQCHPSHGCALRSAPLALSIFRLDRIHGRDLLPVLLQLDAVPDATRCWSCRIGGFPEREQSVV
jgi:hypothetical protein